MLECQKRGVRVYALRLFTIQVSLPATMSIQSKPDINIFMTVKPAAFYILESSNLNRFLCTNQKKVTLFLSPPHKCYEHKVSAYNHVLCVWNAMAHAQKSDFVFRRNGRVHLNRQGRQFSRLLASEVFASAVVMLDTPCSEVVWRLLATHSVRQFSLHFPSRASPCAITFQLESTYIRMDTHL